jgi:hemolysin activation/secretion protein
MGRSAQGKRKAVTVLISGAGLFLFTAALAPAQSAAAAFPQASPLQHITPPAPPLPSGSVPSPPAAGQEEAVPNVAIPVRNVTIIGATAFPEATLNAMTAGLANGSQPLPKLEAARRALLDLYRGQGYVLTTVSLEIDPSGNVSFVVTEGRIVAVKLSQNIGPAGDMVLRFLNHLTEETPIREATLEHWLLLAQQIPGISLHAVLQAEGDDPGALTLVAEVSKQSLSGLLTADNRAFVGAGPAEGLLVGDLNSVTSLGDQTEISLYHTSGNTDNFGQIAESFFIGDRGLRLKLYGGSGRANPTGSLAQVGYQSQLEVFGAALTYPVILRRSQALTVTARFDAVQNVIDTDGALTSNDSLRILRAGESYAWQDLWAGTTRDGLNLTQLQLSKGLLGFGASGDGRTDPPAGRFNERVDFWKITGSVSRTQTLFSPLPASDVALRLQAGGQYTTDILPSEEQFYLGGSQYDRGYYSGEVAGDKAAYATAELQFNTGYDFNLFKQDLELGAQFYSFYDWGETWQNAFIDPGYRIASFGGGMRLGLTRSLEFDGEVTRRLVTQLQPVSSGVPPLNAVGLYWGVTAHF